MEPVLAQRRPRRLGDGGVAASCRQPADTGRPNPALLRVLRASDMLALLWALRVSDMVCSQRRQRQRQRHVQNRNGDRNLWRVVRRSVRPLPPARRLRRLTLAFQRVLRTEEPAPQPKSPTSKLRSRSPSAVVVVAARSSPLCPAAQQRQSRWRRGQVLVAAVQAEAQAPAAAHSAHRAPRRGARPIAEAGLRPGEKWAPAEVPRKGPRPAEAAEVRQAGVSCERVQRDCCRLRRRAKAKAGYPRLGASAATAGGSLTESAVSGRGCGLQQLLLLLFFLFWSLLRRLFRYSR